jgi:hypothetical protein
MQHADLETENQHLRTLLNERDETIAKVKFYLERQSHYRDLDEAIDLMGRQLTEILTGEYDPRKDIPNGQDGKTETGRISSAE